MALPSKCPRRSIESAEHTAGSRDRCDLINLIHVGRLPLLGSLPNYEFVVPAGVEEEIALPPQASAFSDALDAGFVSRVSFTGTKELELFAELSSVLGIGESACLALAEVKGWYVASDERRKFLRMAEQRLGQGRIINTPGTYLLAIRQGLLTVRQADEDKRILAENRFQMGFSSFQDVIGSSFER